VSKIYEALKRAERERAQARVAQALLPAAPAEAEPTTLEEEYSKLRANLLTALGPAPVRTVMVTAARHREGATTVAYGLARSLARDREARVLLIEANLRTPALGGRIGIRQNGGLREVLESEEPIERVAVKVDAGNLWVVPAGKGAAGPEAIDFDFLDREIDRLRPQFDFIFIDGPPVNRYADALILSTKVDGVILVVEADATPVAEAEAAKRQLERVGARILGVVLNRKRNYIPGFLENLL